MTSEVSRTDIPETGEFAAERRRLEAELQASQGLVRLLTENAPAFLAYVDAGDLRYRFVNRQFELAFRRARAEIVGHSVADVIGAPNYQFALPHIEKARAGERTSYTNTFPLAQGTRWLEMNLIPDFDGNHVVSGILVHGYDVTERKEAEATLVKTRERFNQAERLAAIGSWELDLSTNVLSWSDEIFRIFEMDPAHWGASYEAFLRAIHPDDRLAVNEAYTKSVQTHMPYQIEHRLLFADGRIKFVRERGETIYDADGRPLRTLGTIQDISDRRNTERALRQKEEEYRTLAENSPDLIARFDRQLRHLYVNAAAAKAGVLKADEYLGKTIAETGVPPEISGRWDERIQKVFATGEASDIEDVFATPAGLRYFNTQLVPEFDRDGTVHSVQTIARDITERILAEAERDQLHEKLLLSQKMETIGRLAGGIAHEFNNLLAVILMRTELASGLLAPAAPLHRHLAEIDTAARRSAELTRQLLGFARRQTVAPKVLDLNATLAEMLPLLRKLVGADIELRFVPDPLLWTTRLDPVQVDQILVNLCMNARDAIDGRGAIVITTGNTIVEQPDAADPQAPPPDAYVTLTVRDDGCGMGPAVLAHLFEPFFTTKEVGKGTGLGLATIYGIVQQNRGHIRVDSAPGQGATFTIYLPRHGHSEVAPIVTSPQSLSQGQGETVLFVEDEDTVLQMGREALEFLGYAVLPAATSNEAMRLAQTHNGVIDLLITDIIMPEMNGQELARRIAALRPGLKQLFVSGYPSDHIAQRGMLASGVPFLQKPFSLQELATMVRQTLTAAP